MLMLNCHETDFLTSLRLTGPAGNLKMLGLNFARKHMPRELNYDVLAICECMLGIHFGVVALARRVSQSCG